MVCSDEREDKYPFDIQHKHVIKYKTNSPSDYTKLSENITMKIKALKEKSNTIKKLNETPVVDTQGLNSREIALLIFAMENTFSRDETVSVSHLQNSMRASGYRDIATGMGIRTLETKGMLEVLTETDHWNNGQEYTACRLTKTGETWMINNQDQIEFRQPKQPAQTVADDLPF